MPMIRALISPHQKQGKHDATQKSPYYWLHHLLTELQFTAFVAGQGIFCHDEELEGHQVRKEGAPKNYWMISS